MVILTAIGCNEFCLGLYGGTLEDALAALLATAKKVGKDYEKVVKSPGKVIVKFDFGEECDLVSKLAKDCDIGGDPPSTYVLQEIPVPEPGQYVKAGDYVD